MQGCRYGTELHLLCGDVGYKNTAVLFVSIWAVSPFCFTFMLSMTDFYIDFWANQFNIYNMFLPLNDY